MIESLSWSNDLKIINSIYATFFNSVDYRVESPINFYFIKDILRNKPLLYQSGRSDNTIRAYLQVENIPNSEFVLNAASATYPEDVSVVSIPFKNLKLRDTIKEALHNDLGIEIE